MNEPEPKELPLEQQAELHDAARMMLGMIPPPTDGLEDGEPVAA